jgi:hypothetical protein
MSEDMTPRAESAAVRRYLEALQSPPKLRSGWRNPDQRLGELNEFLERKGIDPLARLSAVQERMDLSAYMDGSGVGSDFDQIKTDFVAAAASYAQRKGISYAAWRACGVPAAVLREAGIKQ